MPPAPQAQHWLRRLGDLNVSRSNPDKGPAPHKPLLILAVLSLIEDGLLTSNTLTLSPELVLRFQNLWPVVERRWGGPGLIRLPFHALGSSRDRVWRVLDAEGRPSDSRDSTTMAVLSDELLALLGDSAFRSAVRRRLVGTYFTPVEQVELAALLGFEQEVNEAELEGFRAERENFRKAKLRGRSQRFRNRVPSLYFHTCALTGYRITLAGEDSRQLIEAAHIEAHSVRGNDALENGLALTPTAHVLFDMGLWSVSSDLRILVKPQSAFSELTPEGGFSLRSLHSRQLHIATHARLRPSDEHLAWHRAFHGFA